MKRNVYALRIESERIVAAEVEDDAAAVLFARGNQIYLATRNELATLARRQQKSLLVLHYQQAVSGDPNYSAFEPHSRRFEPHASRAFRRRPLPGIAWPAAGQIPVSQLSR
jgi:hypothetical protein